MNAKWGILLLSAGLLVGATGCRSSIEGTLDVQQNLTGKSYQNLPCNGEAGGPCYSEKTVQFKPGSYKAQLNFNNRTEFEVQIKAKSTETLKVRIPSNMELPENGNFALSSRQSGQPFDMAGTVKTDYQQSETRRERETCTAERWEQECYITPQGRQCHNVLRTYPGFRDTEYYFLDTDQNIVVNLNSVNEANVLAVFTGQKLTRERRYTYQGPCW